MDKKKIMKWIMFSLMCGLSLSSILGVIEIFLEIYYKGYIRIIEPNLYMLYFELCIFVFGFFLFIIFMIDYAKLEINRDLDEF